MGDLIFGESLLHCRALYQPFSEWCIQSKGADALTSGWLLEMSHHMIEDEGVDFGYAKTCMMIVSC